MNRSLRLAFIVQRARDVPYRVTVDCPATIGRDSERDLVLDSQFVSRLHARIELIDGRPVLSDAPSTNGTFVNGRRVRKPVKLNPGDHIGIAEFVLRYQPASRVTKPYLPPGIDDLQVDAGGRDVWISGRKLKHRLPREEFGLLAVLYASRGAVCSHQEIWNEVWGDGECDRNALYQVVSRLRKKIEPNPGRPRFVLSAPGIGYKLAAAQDE